MASAVKDTPLTENSTPEQAAIHLAAADLAPETATRESVDTLLKMATKGKLQLNEQQYTNLTMLKKLFDNAAAYDEEVKLAGAKPQDTVSRAIKTDTIGVDGDLSALQHAQGIRQALVQGDVEGAKAPSGRSGYVCPAYAEQGQCHQLPYGYQGSDHDYCPYLPEAGWYAG